MTAETMGADTPWNKGRLGQKPALTAGDVRAIRAALEAGGNRRDLALFALAIDSRLNACDLVGIRIDDLRAGERMRAQVCIVQKKNRRPLRFALTEPTRRAIDAWLQKRPPAKSAYLFPSRCGSQPHISTRHYARLVQGWIGVAGLDAAAYGTHSLRRAKPAQIYRRTGDLAAAQRLLGHSKRDSTARYLGVACDV